MEPVYLFSDRLHQLGTDLEAWSELTVYRFVRDVEIRKERTINWLGWGQIKPSNGAKWGCQTQFYPDLIDKAAVLAVRITRNHPLPDGNKRLAWQALTMFLALNGWALEVATSDAVSTLLAVAAGEVNEEGLVAWLRQRVKQVEG